MLAVLCCAMTISERPLPAHIPERYSLWRYFRQSRDDPCHVDANGPEHEKC